MLSYGVALFIYQLIRKKLINCFAHHFSSLKIFLLNFCITENGRCSTNILFNKTANTKSETNG